MASTHFMMLHFQVIGDTIYKEDATWNADNNIKDAKAATAESESKADVFSWFCNRGGGSTAGMAYVGSLCTDTKININEKQSTAAGSGFVCFKIILTIFFHYFCNFGCEFVISCK